jgi:YHS domain-containing protein
MRAPLSRMIEGPNRSLRLAMAEGGTTLVSIDASNAKLLWRHDEKSPIDYRTVALREGVTYFFSSADHLAQFQREPSRYQPAYHGYDATRMVYALPEAADPAIWRNIDGRIFLFADAASKAAFELDLAGNIALADKYWGSEVAGSNSSWHNLRRRVDRVPHYRSRDELAEAVAAAKGKSG